MSNLASLMQLKGDLRSWTDDGGAHVPTVNCGPVWPRSRQRAVQNRTQPTNRFYFRPNRAKLAKSSGHCHQRVVEWVRCRVATKPPVAISS